MTLPWEVRFPSHSIVATETGELIDVPFGSQDKEHPFIEHPGTEEEFLAPVANNGCAWINFKKPAGPLEYNKSTFQWVFSEKR